MYLGRTLKGDLGKTLLDERPVLDLFRELLWSTVSLGIVSWVFATALGIPLGILSAVKRGTLWDYIGRGVALLGVSMTGIMEQHDICLDPKIQKQGTDIVKQVNKALASQIVL